MGHFDKVLLTILGIAAAIGGAIWYWESSVFLFISNSKNQSWIGFWGLYLTLLGLSLAGHQLWKVRSATRAVQAASAALIKQVQSSTRMFEAVELKRDIQLFKTNVQHQQLEAALQSLDSVKNRFAFLKEFVADNAEFAADLNEQADKLEQIEVAIRIAHTKTAKLRDPVKLVLEIGKIEAVAMTHAAKFALISRTERHV